MKFVVGDSVSVLEKDDKYYKCKVVNVSTNQIKVHYIGWKKSYDEWLPIDCDRLKKYEESCVDPDQPLCTTDDASPAAPTMAEKELQQLSPGGAHAASHSSKSMVSSGRGVTGAGVGEICVDLAGVPKKSEVCAFCACAVSFEFVTCSDCGKFFHAAPQCVGLTEMMIRGLLDGGKALTYHCTHCRYGHSNSHQKAEGKGDNSAFDQLLVAVGALCAQVRMLTENFRALHAKPLGLGGIDAASGKIQVNQMVREEVFEVQEQSKRRANVILKGFGDDVNDAKTKFKEVSKQLINVEYELDDIVKVNGQSGMYRCKILNEEIRTEILLNAKKMKDIDRFKKVFIQRDLTYKQRQEMYKKRELFRSQAAGQSDIPVGSYAEAAKIGGSCAADHGSLRNAGRGVSHGAARGGMRGCGIAGPSNVEKNKVNF
jgi:hypothetical protein